MLPHQWQLYKSLRCAALAEAPYAFSTTLEDARQRSDEDWQHITRQYASHPNSHTYFAYVDRSPCGMAACVISGDEVELYGVWVDPAYRRKGIGRALIAYARQWSQAKGAAQLRVGLFEDNLTALEFYRSVGFIDSGQIDPVLSKDTRRVLLFIISLRSGH